MINLRQLAQICGTKKYVTDDVFFYQGDPGTEMFILLSGTVGVYLSNIDGSSFQVTKLLKGNFFGEMSLLEEAPRSATIQALEDCLVLVITKENFEVIVSKQPLFAFRLLKVLSSRIRNLNDRLVKLEQTSGSLSLEKSEKVPAPIPVFSKEVPTQKQDLFENRLTYQKEIAPEKYNEFLFDKKINCPCCNEPFTVKMMRTTSIPLEKIDIDLREIYKGFEPIWYMIWICPSCAYANFYYKFLQVSKNIKEYVEEKSSLIQKNFTLTFSDPRNLYEVFDAYYQLLFILEGSKSPSIDIAKTWMRLCWLYRDSSQKENERFCLEKALHYYRDTYFNTDINITPKQDARMNLLIAEIFYQLGQEKESLRIFRNAIINKEAEQFVKTYAEDRVEIIKKNKEKSADTDNK